MVCDKRFNVAHTLRKHVKVVHHQIKKFICQVCKKGFAVKRSLRYHLKQIHNKCLDKMDNITEAAK